MNAPRPAIRRLALLLVAATLAVACAKPRIDATTGESLKRSLQKVRESLPEKRRAAFDAALVTIYESQIDFRTLLNGFSGIASIGANVQHALDGKTADEVIALAEKLKKERPMNPFENAWAARVGGALSQPILTADRLKANILEMMKAGVGTDVIVRYVRSVSLQAPLTAEQIVDWKNAGISDQVLGTAVAR